MDEREVSLKCLAKKWIKLLSKLELMVSWGGGGGRKRVMKGSEGKGVGGMMEGREYFQ